MSEINEGDVFLIWSDADSDESVISHGASREQMNEN